MKWPKSEENLGFGGMLGRMSDQVPPPPPPPPIGWIRPCMVNHFIAEGIQTKILAMFWDGETLEKVLNFYQRPKIAQQNIPELKTSWSMRPASPTQEKTILQVPWTFSNLSLVSIFNQKHLERSILLWFDLVLQKVPRDLKFLENSASRYGHGSETIKILNPDWDMKNGV